MGKMPMRYPVLTVVLLLCGGALIAMAIGLEESRGNPFGVSSDTRDAIALVLLVIGAATALGGLIAGGQKSTK